MSRRVFLHVGAPKTGTSFLQSTLDANRTLLASHGLTYPQTESGSHFEAAIDLIEHPWGGRLEQVRGAWDELAASARRAPGDVLISHEVLAAATPEQVQRARASFAGADLHVVYTARDLARQVPAEWQETVKHRSRTSLRDYCTEIVEAPRAGSEEWFWRVQHLPDVLGRWGAGLDPDHVHLVTVPQAGAPRDELWRRFARVLGLDERLDLVPGTADNTSLGMVEVAMLRRLNNKLRRRSVPHAVYAEVVRETIVREVLAPTGEQRSSQPRTTLPPDLRGFVEEVTAEWTDWVEGSRIDVVGDVADLVSRWPADDEDWQDPDKVLSKDMLDAALESLSRLVVIEAERFRENRDRRDQPTRPPGGLRRRLGL